MKFSERYVKPVEVLKRDFLDKEGATALCNCFDHLAMWLNQYDVNCGNRHDESYATLEETIWCFFLNQRRDSFYGFNTHKVVATEYLLDDINEWYRKFDLVEFSIKCLNNSDPRNRSFQEIVEAFKTMLNSTFKRLNYAYRIVDNQITEITDEEEISSIEEALKQNSTIKTHLSDALKHLSNRPIPDYRNSIKESISSVEVLCREITGESTLGDALRVWEKKGIKIPTYLKSGIDKLYVYTNDKRPRIRHAMMDESEVPSFEEAKFMLVACSAFVNYIQGKRSATE